MTVDEAAKILLKQFPPGRPLVLGPVKWINLPDRGPVLHQAWYVEPLMGEPFWLEVPIEGSPAGDGEINF